MTPEQLVCDIREAQAAAEKALDGVQDGGTCNMDCVHIPARKGHPIPRRNAAYLKALEEAGLSVIDREDGYWKGYLLIPSTGGQAHRRTLACETISRILSEKGWKTSVYYQMD